MERPKSRLNSEHKSIGRYYFSGYRDAVADKQGDHLLMLHDFSDPFMIPVGEDSKSSTMLGTIRHTFTGIDAQAMYIDSNSAKRGVILTQTKMEARYAGGNPQNIFSSSRKPYLDLLRTPSGRNILSDAPADHPHHHGLMFGLRVDGCNFWEEQDESGRQVCNGSDFMPFGIGTLIDRVDSKNNMFLSEKRRLVLFDYDEASLLDWESQFTAEKDLKLGGGGGHYYGLGMRFDKSMDNGGRFFNDTGAEGELVRDDERLTECRWMAYTANLHGEPVTVAILGHPDNPVPMYAFTMGDAGNSFSYLAATQNFHREPKEMAKGESLKFKYRVALWDGEISPERVQKAYDVFCPPKREKQ